MVWPAGQKAVVRERVERGDELALRQIARRAEDHEAGRVGNALLLQTFAKRIPGAAPPLRPGCFCFSAAGGRAPPPPPPAAGGSGGVFRGRLIPDRDRRAKPPGPRKGDWGDDRAHAGTAVRAGRRPTSRAPPRRPARLVALVRPAFAHRPSVSVGINARARVVRNRTDRARSTVWVIVDRLQSLQDLIGCHCVTAREQRDGDRKQTRR